MKTLAWTVAWLGCIGLTIGLIVAVEKYREGPVYYNCSLAEISPDIPIKVKEECRKLRSQNSHTTKSY